MKVKLESYNSGELSILSDANGTFSFTGLAPGSYTVVVDGGDDYESVREPVYIETEASSSSTDARPIPISRQYTIQVSLQPKRGESSKPGVINAALASVPTQARDLYQEAVAAAQAGDSKKAIERLSGALSVYPEFPLALNELGVQYLRIGEAIKAAEALSRAVKLVPEEFQPRLNYGIALLNQRKFAEAEEQLRIAININTSAPTAHMYLGIALAVERKLAEGEKELEIAIDSKSNEVTLAYRYLGGVFLERHEYHRAADELETYLKLFPKAADADALRQEIKELRSKG